jgi:hypothetical protein
MSVLMSNPRLEGRRLQARRPSSFANGVTGLGCHAHVLPRVACSEKAPRPLKARAFILPPYLRCHRPESKARPRAVRVRIGARRIVHHSERGPGAPVRLLNID